MNYMYVQSKPYLLEGSCLLATNTMPCSNFYYFLFTIHINDGALAALVVTKQQVAFQ